MQFQRKYYCDVKKKNSLFFICLPSKHGNKKKIVEKFTFLAEINFLV